MIQATLIIRQRGKSGSSVETPRPTEGFPYKALDGKASPQGRTFLTQAPGSGDWATTPYVYDLNLSYITLT